MSNKTSKFPLAITLLISVSVAVGAGSAAAFIATTSSHGYSASIQVLPNGTIALVCGDGTHSAPNSCIPNNQTQPVPPINETNPPVVNDSTPVPPINDSNPVPPVNDSNPVPPIVNDSNTVPPQPAKDIKAIVVGDIADTTAGNKVYQAIKAQNADYVFVLGDLGYSSSLKWFKSTYGTSEKVYCVVGNHEAANEDGSASIEQETKQFCGNSYWIKNGATLFVLLNTNDPNLSTLATKTGQVFTNSSIMSGVKTVHIMSHKPCQVPPNSHHPLEIKSFCDAIKSKIPNGVKVFYDQAHNHVMSQSADGTYKQVGSGGKSHYTCPSSPSSEFPFCNASSYGYLQYTIKPDGTTTSSFVDYNGVVKK